MINLDNVGNPPPPYGALSPPLFELLVGALSLEFICEIVFGATSFFGNCYNFLIKGKKMERIEIVKRLKHDTRSISVYRFCGNSISDFDRE